MSVIMISLDPQTVEIITSQHMMFFCISIIFASTFQDFWMVLFVCLTHVAAINIEAITKDVSTRSFQRRNVSLYWIRQWKKNYFAVQEYVKEIDRFYGPTTVLIFGKISIRMIIACYKFIAVLFQNETENPLASFVLTTMNILLATGFIVATQRMEKKVIRIQYLKLVY